MPQNRLGQPCAGQQNTPGLWWAQTAGLPELREKPDGLNRPEIEDLSGLTFALP
jgi:hypothetical protein